MKPSASASEAVGAPYFPAMPLKDFSIPESATKSIVVNEPAATGLSGRSVISDVFHVLPFNVWSPLFGSPSDDDDCEGGKYEWRVDGSGQKVWTCVIRTTGGRWKRNIGDAWPYMRVIPGVNIIGTLAQHIAQMFQPGPEMPRAPPCNDGEGWLEVVDDLYGEGLPGETCIYKYFLSDEVRKANTRRDASPAAPAAHADIERRSEGPKPFQLTLEPYPEVCKRYVWQCIPSEKRYHGAFKAYADMDCERWRWQCKAAIEPPKEKEEEEKKLAAELDEE